MKPLSQDGQDMIRYGEMDGNIHLRTRGQQLVIIHELLLMLVYLGILSFTVQQQRCDVKVSAGPLKPLVPAMPSKGSAVLRTLVFGASCPMCPAQTTKNAKALHSEMSSAVFNWWLSCQSPLGNHHPTQMCGNCHSMVT